MKAIIHYGLFFIFTLSGCTNKMELNENSIPNTLLIGVYVGEGHESTVSRLLPIQKYLEDKLNLPVELIKANDYTAVIEALRANKVHMAYLPPFAYVLAKEKTNIEVMITLGLNGKPSNYRSVILTAKNSEVKNMEDVKANAKDLTLAFTDPASASGHLVPGAYLKSIGLDTKTSFKETLFASGHTAAVMAVKSGKVDIACSIVLITRLLIKKGMLKEDDIRILWTSDPIVTDPIVIRGDINKQFADKVKKAYLDLAADAPEVWQEYLASIYGKEKNDSLCYIVAHDSLYNGIRKLASGLTDLSTHQ